MNILYIDHYAGSMSMGMEFRPYYFAKEWQKMGHKVRIIGATYSHLRRENPKIEKDFEIQIIEGIEYQWVQTGIYEGNGVKRAVSMFEFCGKLWRHAKEIVKEFHPEVVISSSTYPLDAYPAKRIADISGAKYIHEAHDLWPLTLTELGGMSKWNPFVILLGWAEHYAFSKSDTVVGVAPNEVEYMLKHGLQSREKFTYIPNGVVEEDWNNPAKLDAESERQFDQLHRSNKFIVEYLGGHALSNALDTLIDAAELMKADSRFVFVLVGKGVEKEKLIAKAQEKNLKNLFFLPPIRKDQVPTALAQADALYIGAAPCSLYRFGVSMNKVYDYMMAGKPIIYGVDAFNNEVEEANAGVTIEPGSSESIVQALEELYSYSDQDKNKLGVNGREWVLKNCEYKVLARRFSSCF